LKHSEAHRCSVAAAFCGNHEHVFYSEWLMCWQLMVNADMVEGQMNSGEPGNNRSSLTNPIIT
jgi:hypothetical protein